MQRTGEVLSSLQRDKLVPPMYPFQSKNKSPQVEVISPAEQRFGYLSGGATSPTESIGIVHINPDFTRFLSDKEIATILLHESFHVRHLQEINRIIRKLPDNKFNRMVARMVRRKHELDADSYTFSIIGAEFHVSSLLKFYMLSMANFNPDVLKSQNSYIIRTLERKLHPEEMSLMERLQAFIDNFGCFHPTLVKRILNATKNGQNNMKQGQE